MGLIISTEGSGFPPRGDKGSFKLPFQEQIDFFNQKHPLPSQHYDDILKAAHDKAFIVAGAAKADLLADLHSAVKQAINEGKTLDWFRGQFDSIVKKHGWTGWTGEGTDAGVAWRTRVIYQTNLSTSYAAGRWAQLHDPDLLSVRPYWKYIHNDSVAHPRELHQSWNGTVLPHDHPWWATHFAPNGWGCRCRIMAVRAREYKGHPAPNDGTYQVTDRNGVTHTLPKGVDYGFDYAPGASVNAGLIANKSIGLPPVLATALKKYAAKVIPNKKATTLKKDAAKTIPLKKVSSLFKLPKSGAGSGDDIVNALNVIDSIHKTDVLPVIPIKNSTSKTTAGSYVYRGDNPMNIVISSESPHKELTLFHETGHFLDHQAFGIAGEWSSETAVLFEEWRKAVDSSNATKNIVKLGTVKNSAYYLSRKEQWARSYAQYIATKSGDINLTAKVERITKSPSQLYRNSQWLEDDFLPILIAIDNLFKQIGWIE